MEFGIFNSLYCPHQAVEASPDPELVEHTRLMDEALSSLPPGWVFAGLIKPFPPRRLLDLLDSVNGN